MRALALGVLLLWPRASAGPEEDVRAVSDCLALQDVACAQGVVTRAGMETSPEPVLRSVAAEVALYAGDYPRAYDLLASAVELGLPDADEALAHYERTMYATAGWVEVPRGRFRVRYAPGTDAVLVDDAAAALQRTDERVTPLLGVVPPGQTIVELYPDGRSFVAASSLTLDDVQSTGVVALSKWSRLLVSSPRSLGRGYDWQGTLSHEYIHLVVAHNTADKAPVWLQEAIAKYLDGHWQPGFSRFKLNPTAAAWLGAALEQNDLVPFSEMHPSLAKIKVFKPDGSIDPEASARRAGVAYAQLATLMAYCFQVGGDDVLKVALPRVRDGEDPRVALAHAAGASSFDALIAGWEQWVRTLGLVGKEVAAAPTVLDGGAEEELDPVMARRKDLWNFVRLGDLLREAGRPRAAMVEYGKARENEETRSPVLDTRMASALVDLQDLAGARALLQGTVAEQPEHAPAWQALGMVAHQQGRLADAADAWRHAVALNPFHLPTQVALLEAYKELGDPRAVDQGARVTLLREGGELVDHPPLHTREGRIELPRSPEAEVAKEGDRVGLEGQPAPDFAVTSLAGDEVRLSKLRGKVVLVDFWATWCGPCRATMPALSAMQEQLGAQGLVVLSVSDELQGTVKGWVAAEKAKGRELRQTLALEGGQVRRAYGVSSLPTLVVIDRGGIVREVHVGAGDQAALRALVEQLLAESGAK